MSDTAQPQLKPLGAGEGGRLPKGLSLFRFFLFSGLMLGAAYGGAALYFGGPPWPGAKIPGEVPAAEWRPSPIWLPVFAAVHSGAGVKHTDRGYAFEGRGGQAVFGLVAMALGILAGGAAGWGVGEAARRYILSHGWNHDPD